MFYHIYFYYIAILILLLKLIIINYEKQIAQTIYVFEFYATR